MRTARRKNKIRSSTGFSIIEMLLVLGIITVLGVVLALSLAGRRASSELALTAQNIAAALREAQSRAQIQASSSVWGVHFDNGGSPFYAVFVGAAYSTSTQYSRYALPLPLAFTTGTVPQNGAANVNFAQITGAASGSSSITIYQLQNPANSSTISIDSTGAVSY